MSTDAHVNSALTQLRQVYARVRAFGNLEHLLKNPPRGAIKEALDDELEKITAIARYLRDALADRVASESLPVARISPDLWRFYEKDFLPNQEVLHSLYSDSFYAEFDLSEESGHLGPSVGATARTAVGASERRIEAAFRIGMNLVRDRFEDNQDWWELDDDDVKKAERIQSAAFFTPEEWNRNMEEVRPVVTARPLSGYPVHVRVRMKEIGRSFIFENWLATLALCRSLLEYALIDRSGKWRVEAYESVKGKRRAKRLADLIDEYRPRTPECVRQMETIKEFGNHVMHPSEHYDVIRFPEIMRKDALHSVDAIRDVIEKLYA